MKREQTAVGGVVVIGLSLTLGACGWTPRDEFSHDRSVMISGRPGDGSEIAANWKQSQRQEAHAAQQASRFADE
jgi:hypothetical protein